MPHLPRPLRMADDATGAGGAGNPQPPAGTPPPGPAAPLPGAAAAPPPRTPETALPPNALAARLRGVEETTKRKILAELGVEDVAAFKAAREAEVAKLREFEAKAEEARRGAMTEQERLKSDNDRLTAEVAELRRQLDARETDVQAARADVLIRSTISAHIDPSMEDDAQEALKRHIRALPKVEQRKFGKEEASAFFANLAKTKPRYAREGAPPLPPKKLPERRPLSNGASPQKVAPGPAKVTATPAANGAKKLSKEEAAALWRKHGATRMANGG